MLLLLSFKSKFARLTMLCVACLFIQPTLASDHDDGELDLKGRSLNITDVFAFREDAQTGNAADSDNLILIMNTNPRSLPGQQYYFSTQARYEIHLGRQTDKNTRPSGQNDVTIRLKFGNPDAQNRQDVTLTMIKDGQEIERSKTKSGGTIYSSSLADSKAGNVISNTIDMGGNDITMFAGLREDPFFFDVQAFFAARAAVAAGNAFPGFRSAAEAVDFASDYNVNAIVLRVPISMIQSGLAERVFDVWTTISVKQ